MLNWWKWSYDKRYLANQVFQSRTMQKYTPLSEHSLIRSTVYSKHLEMFQHTLPRYHHQNHSLQYIGSYKCIILHTQITLTVQSVGKTVDNRHNPGESFEYRTMFGQSRPMKLKTFYDCFFYLNKKRDLLMLWNYEVWCCLIDIRTHHLFCS